MTFNSGACIPPESMFLELLSMLLNQKCSVRSEKIGAINRNTTDMFEYLQFHLGAINSRPLYRPVHECIQRFVRCRTGRQQANSAGGRRNRPDW